MVLKVIASFPGGVHPPERKGLSKEQAIQLAPVPDEVVIPLAQHLGAPCVPAVKKKETVDLGQVVGHAAGFVSAPVHATVSGTVKTVEERPHPSGKRVMSVVITNDGEDRWAEGLNQERDVDAMDADAIRQAVNEAGIVGLGGATFPTHVKMSPSLPIDTVILNGAECEPYLTSDYRLMLEEPEAIVEGLKILMRVLDAPAGIIGIEDNKPDAAEVLGRVAADVPGVDVRLCRTKYPQGGEKQLIQALLGREVPSPTVRGLPMNVGVVVQNVGTAAAIRDAVRYARPLYQRVVTVTGEGVENPGNFMTRIGTPYSVLLDLVGVKGDATKLIMGGPMMGATQMSTAIPVVKGTSGILVLPGEMPDSFGGCIRCGSCVDACAMRLIPSELSVISEAERFEMMEDAHVWDCMECGSCSYVCPARRPIVQQIRLGKSALSKQRQREAEKKRAAEAAAE
jgi:H+/Na+-translocating ferredoxin:NAD+ oxidoreductase subunit C